MSVDYDLSWKTAPAALETRNRWNDYYPAMTYHAVERWDQRAPGSAVSPEMAFATAISEFDICDHPEFAEATDDGVECPVELRLYVDYDQDEGLWGMVFLVAEDNDEGATDKHYQTETVVSTCIRLDWMHDSRIRWYLWNAALYTPDDEVRDRWNLPTEVSL